MDPRQPYPALRPTPKQVGMLSSSKSVGLFKGNENLEHEADEFERTPVKPIKLPKQRKNIKGMTDAK